MCVCVLEIEALCYKYVRRMGFSIQLQDHDQNMIELVMHKEYIQMVTIIPVIVTAKTTTIIISCYNPMWKQHSN